MVRLRNVGGGAPVGRARGRLLSAEPLHAGNPLGCPGGGKGTPRGLIRPPEGGAVAGDWLGRATRCRGWGWMDPEVHLQTSAVHSGKLRRAGVG